MENNIEISFYMETNQVVNMNYIADVLDINNAAFCSKGELCTSKNKKIKYISEVSYYSFGIKRQVNTSNKIDNFFYIIKTKRKLLKKIFNDFSFTKEIIIYTWGNDEEDIHLNLNTEQIKLISDIDINLSIIHYN